MKNQLGSVIVLCSWNLEVAMLSDTSLASVC